MNASRRAFMLAASAALTLSAAPALARQELSADERRMLERAQTYLQGMRSARGRFIETGPRGRTMNGAFYLRRPGRMRFEYDAPSRLIVTADGSFIHRWDPRLETHSRVPMNQTPLSILLGEQVSFSNRYIQVDRVAETEGGFEVVVRDRRRAREGSLTLEFGGSPLRLRGWTVTDAQGGRTQVRLISLNPASGLADSLFRDPRG